QILLLISPFAAAFMLLYWVIGPTVAILYVATLIGLVVIVAPIGIIVGMVIAYFVNPDDVTIPILVGSIVGPLLALVLFGGLLIAGTHMGLSRLYECGLPYATTWENCQVSEWGNTDWGTAEQEAAERSDHQKGFGMGVTACALGESERSGFSLTDMRWRGEAVELRASREYRTGYSEGYESRKPCFTETK
ncbi:hypothetical protein LCGC14_2452010, partial [marine sediment metagenome]